MNYKCEVCGKINECPHNTSGYGICPKCTPEYMKKLNALPKSGKLEDLPDEFNPFKSEAFKDFFGKENHV